MPMVENHKEMVPFEHYVGLYAKLDPAEAAERCGVAYDPAAMLEGFASICAAWPVHADDEYESAGLNINKSKDADGEPVTVVDAVYIIHCDDQDYQAQFSTREDSAGSGLIGFQVDSVQSLIDNGIEPAGGNTPAAGKTPAQWGLTVFWILACVFCLITIIDIVRKKPKLWGLWILIALVFIGFSADKWSGGSRFLARFGLLLSSESLRLLCEVFLPYSVGAAVFFILIDIRVDDVVPVRTLDLFLEWQAEDLVMLTEEPCIRFAARESCAVYS